MFVLVLVLCVLVNAFSYDLLDNLSDETLSDMFDMDIEDMEYELLGQFENTNARNYDKGVQDLKTGRSNALQLIKEGRNKINDYSKKARQTMNGLDKKQKRAPFW